MVLKIALSFFCTQSVQYLIQEPNEPRTKWTIIVNLSTDTSLTTLIPFKKFTSQETLIHAVWGFLNTKTYTIVLLLHMMNSGVTIPIWIWLIDAKFQVTTNISKFVSYYWMHWVELFYHQHRMAHLPKVLILSSWSRRIVNLLQLTSNIYLYTLKLDTSVYPWCASLFFDWYISSCLTHHMNILPCQGCKQIHSTVGI